MFPLGVWSPVQKRVVKLVEPQFDCVSLSSRGELRDVKHCTQWENKDDPG